MSESDFLGFLLAKKHSKTSADAHDAVGKASGRDICDLVSAFERGMDEKEFKNWLERLEKSVPVEEEIEKDIVFGILYAQRGFSKQVKSKEFPYKAVAELYHRQFQANKKYLMEYNKEKGDRKDGGSSTAVKLDLSSQKKEKTRFPPEPSGYLHIGHAKAAILNKTMAKGDGTLVVRIDDTNPEKESALFEQAIFEDLKMLRITEYERTHSSDYFDRIFEHAVQLIKEGKAYVDDTEREQMQSERTEGIPSKNRDMEPEKALKIFLAMKEGKHSEYCLRAKISVDDLNKAMRDPVIYRSSAKPHSRTGDRYKIYPTYDFTVPIVDSIEGITLALRSNEYRDRNPLYCWFIDALHLENKPRICDFSRLCFDNTVVSKRKMRYYVENGFVEGWDDPRLCTLRGLRRSGMHPDALIEYIVLQGASQKTAVNSWDKIWAMNKRVIDPISPRYSAVPEEKCVVCEILGVIEEEKEIAKHKKNLELGSKKVLYASEIIIAQEDARVLAEGEEFTLMGWGNAIVEKKETENDTVRKVVLRLHLDGDFKQTKNKINWVSKKGSVTIKLNEYGSLQNDSDSDDLEACFNRDSKKTSWWIAEQGIREVEVGSCVQLERVGFFYCDKLYEYNLIPFTKQRRVTR